ncbi:hypothetical protein GO730_11525 [Spirosoma sp. HMF3257]|uniref:O-antigen ligase family protein n=1 Tax=Spirosoma telluris TaxID=2183553 RepID=A0A327NH65_9BACT|nr:hypothetical protein [Spirosoma telluris]RAI74720.1 hypothetical protein HMF3257_11435 [Spirosoma telluris]
MWLRIVAIFFNKTLEAIPAIYKLPTTTIWIKRSIWVYFFLLIFEGAIRRWVLPGLAQQLVIIRDPFAIIILILAWQYSSINRNPYIWFSTFLSIISFATTIVLGHGNIPVALFGLRITLIHFPLIFVIAKFFDKRDIELLTKWMVILTIPMLILIVIQFYSPQTSWINKGYYNSEVGAGFRGANGYFRPPGTFSFINGLAMFFTVSSAFVLYALFKPINLPRWVVYVALCCQILSIPFSISRTLFFGVSLIVLCFLLISVRTPKILASTLTLTLLIVILAVILGNVSFFAESLSAFTERFTSANKTEGGVQDSLFKRTFEGLFLALDSVNELPFFGKGLGLGTNVGSQLEVGKAAYLISEDEWGRMIGEMGLLLSFLFILLRFRVCIIMIKAAFASVKSRGLLSWLLLSFCVNNELMGLWGQPTALGFSIFFSGILLSASKYNL